MTDEHEVIEISDDDDEEVEKPKRKRMRTSLNLITELAPTFPTLMKKTGFEYAHEDDKVPGEGTYLTGPIHRLTEDVLEYDGEVEKIKKYLDTRFADLTSRRKKITEPELFYRRISRFFPKQQYMKLIYLLLTGNLQTAEVLHPDRFHFAPVSEVEKRLAKKDSWERKILKHIEKNGLDHELRTTIIRDTLDAMYGLDNIPKMNVYDIWAQLATIFFNGVNILFSRALGKTQFYLEALAKKNSDLIGEITKRLAEKSMTPEETKEAQTRLNELDQEVGQLKKKKEAFFDLLNSENKYLNELNKHLINEGLIPGAHERRLEREELRPTALFPDLYDDYPSDEEKGLKDPYPSDEEKEEEVWEDNQPPAIFFKSDLTRKVDKMAMHEPTLLGLDTFDFRRRKKLFPPDTAWKILMDWIRTMLEQKKKESDTEVLAPLLSLSRGYSLDTLADMFQLDQNYVNRGEKVAVHGYTWHKILRAEFSNYGSVSTGELRPIDYFLLSQYSHQRAEYLSLAITANLTQPDVAKFLAQVLELISFPNNLKNFQTGGRAYTKEQIDKINKTWVGIWSSPYFFAPDVPPTAKYGFLDQYLTFMGIDQKVNAQNYFDRIERFICYLSVDTNFLTGVTKSSLKLQFMHAIAVQILINENKVIVYDSSDIIRTPKQLHLALMLGNPGFYRYLVQRMQKAGFKKQTIAVWRKSAPLFDFRDYEYTLSDLTFPVENEEYIAEHTIFRGTQMNPEGTCALQTTYTCFFLALNPSYYAPPFLRFSSTAQNILYPMRHDKAGKDEVYPVKLSGSLLREEPTGLLSVNQFARYVLCCFMAGRILNFEQYTKHTGAGIIKSKKSLPKAKKIK